MFLKKKGTPKGVLIPSDNSATEPGTEADDAGPDPAAAAAAPPPAFKPTRDFLLAYASLMMLCLAVALDATTLSVALPIMSTELSGSALQAFWSGTGFLLASSVFQPTVASLSSIFGRNYLIYVTSLFFGIGSLIAALAHSFNVVVIGRVIQGGGGGGLIALTEVVLTDLVPLAERGKYISMLSAIWSVGTVAGPLIGAGFAQDATWRWIFWMNLPVIAAGVAMVFFFLRQEKIPGAAREKLQRFDYVGAVLFVAGSTAFLFGVSSGGVMYEWASWQTLLAIIAGAAVMIVFGLWEVRFAERLGTEPLVNRGIFNNWSIISVDIQSVLHGAILWSLIYFLILYYQGVKLYSPITSAVACLPETLTVAPAAVAVGVIAGITGHYRWALWSGWVIATFGGGLLLLLAPATSVPQWVFLNIPIGIGTGMVFPSSSLAIQASSPPRLNANAIAFSSFLRTFGQSIGVAASGVIFQNALRTELARVPGLAADAGRMSRDATMIVGVILEMGPGPERDVMVNAYSEALGSVWIALTAMAGVCMLLSFTVKRYSLQQEHVTKQKFVSGQRGEEAGRDVEVGEKR